MLVSTLLRVNRIFLILIFISIGLTASGQSVSKKDALSFVESFFVRNKPNLSNDINVFDIKNIKYNSKTLGYVFNIVPKGFILVSANNEKSPIVGFSFNNNFNFTKENIEIVSSFLQDNFSTTKEEITKKNPQVESVGPLIKSLFGQVNCYDEDDNLINVSNLFTPNNYAPGCVAVSLSTLLHYYQWPTRCTGSHTYEDKYGSSKGTYSVDFEQEDFDWDNILNRYRYKKTNNVQREALGKLVYNSAVALDMNFESTGSTSNINRIPNTGKDYFRFIAREVPASSFIFWKAVDSNLVHKIPVIFSISASNGAGHSIVCDGFKFDNGIEYHHVNMGWWGNANGWYNIKSGFNVGGYNKINNALIDFLPIPMINPLKISDDSSQLEVIWEISNTITPEFYELQIKTDTSNWTKISDTLTSNIYKMDIDEIVKEYSFRIRSKFSGKWYDGSWSNISIFKRNSTSILVEGINQLNIYPNPCSDIINIDLNGKYIVYLFSIDGDLIFKKMQSENSVISMKDFENGVYFLKIQKGTEFTTSRLVKIE